LSILIVIGGHFLLHDRGGFAAVGVYVFFAISGFLITRLMFLENKGTGRVDILQFYIRRVLRLYPVLIVYIAVMVGVESYRDIHTPTIEIASVFFYFVNYLMAWNALHGQYIHSQIGVLWSLSVEEHFYLIMPLFFVVVRGRLRPMLYFAAAAFVLPLLIRCFYTTFWSHDICKLISYRNSETRFDSIAVGMILAILCESSFRIKVVQLLSSKKAFALCILLFAVGFLPGDFYKDTLRYTVTSVASVLLISVVMFGEGLTPLQRLANHPTPVWIGRLSYSLYVWHQFMKFLLQPVDGSLSARENEIALFALTFVAASLSYYLVEQPVLRLKNLRFFKRRSRAPVS